MVYDFSFNIWAWFSATDHKYNASDWLERVHCTIFHVLLCDDLGLYWNSKVVINWKKDLKEISIHYIKQIAPHYISNTSYIDSIIARELSLSLAS